MYERPSKAQCDATFSSDLYSLKSYGKRFSNDFIYLRICALEDLNISFVSHFSTEQEYLKMESVSSETRRVRLADKLKMTLELIKSNSQFREEYAEAVKKIKSKRSSRINTAEVPNYIEENALLATQFSSIKSEKMSKFLQNEESRLFDAHVKKTENINEGIARKIVIINRLDIKKTSDSIYSQICQNLLRKKEQMKGYLKLIYLIKYLNVVKLIFKRDLASHMKTVMLRIAVYRITGVMYIRLKILNLKKEMRGLRPMHNYGIYWKNTVQTQPKNRSINNIKKTIINLWQVFELNKKCKDRFAKIKKVKCILKRFIILHKERILMLAEYWKQLVEEYKQLATKFKVQSFLPTLLENIKTIESIGIKKQMSAYNYLVKQYYMKNVNKRRQNNFTNKIKIEIASMQNIVYQIYSGKKKPATTIPASI